jgi:hypothetical protein
MGNNKSDILITHIFSNSNIDYIIYLIDNLNINISLKAIVYFGDVSYYYVPFELAIDLYNFELASVLINKMIEKETDYDRIFKYRSLHSLVINGRDDDLYNLLYYYRKLKVFKEDLIKYNCEKSLKLIEFK